MVFLYVALGVFAGIAVTLFVVHRLTLAAFRRSMGW
jgi:hypothetical protein